MVRQSPFRVLDVDPGASKAEVQAAYRRYAQRHHPDRGGDPASFQAGTEAYVALASGCRSVAPPNVVFHRRLSGAQRLKQAAAVTLAGVGRRLGVASSFIERGTRCEER